jgi:hypothetical protein
MYFSSAVAVKAEFTLDCKAIKRFQQQSLVAFKIVIHYLPAEAVNNNSSESSIASIV